ncbi:hypothetical protein [Fibrella aquatilis]|uniref:Uncharacterized protein n=1 Tax=Fibrella aquatilis TaxID=2817059 RepID=A0A939G8S7_9BACT|nr:hypothetical protein [Fibrella aquatilis]MBO0932445.1 hypothetical protein [Fibrella aquatilis]
MAHFFDAVSYSPLVTYEIHPGETRTVGLWGGDFLGNDLGVVVDQDLVKMQEKRRVNGSRYFDLTGLKIGQTSLRAFAGLYDFAFPIEVKVTKKLSTPQGKLAERKAIVDEALSHVGKAHYVWGAAGNTPGLADGASFRRDLVKLLPTSFSQQEPLVRTAWTGIEGVNTCAGCSSKYSQQSSQSISNYLKAGKDEPGKNGLFPRIWKFKGKVQPRGASGNGLVWGESCIGKRHFDCIGFVEYCIGKVWSQTTVFQIDIAVLFNNPGHYGFAIVTDPTDILNADLVSHDDGGGKWHHIGMVYLDEKNQAKIVQAADSDIGVTSGEIYVPRQWGHRIRLLDSMVKTPVTARR